MPRSRDAVRAQSGIAGGSDRWRLCARLRLPTGASSCGWRRSRRSGCRPAGSPPVRRRPPTRQSRGGGHRRVPARGPWPRLRRRAPRPRPRPGPREGPPALPRRNGCSQARGGARPETHRRPRDPPRGTRGAASSQLRSGSCRDMAGSSGPGEHGREVPARAELPGAACPRRARPRGAPRPGWVAGRRATRARPWPPAARRHRDRARACHAERRTRLHNALQG